MQLAAGGLLHDRSTKFVGRRLWAFNHHMGIMSARWMGMNYYLCMLLFFVPVLVSKNVRY